jgi:hypothetical protein
MIACTSRKTFLLLYYIRVYFFNYVKRYMIYGANDAGILSFKNNIHE